MEIIFVLWMQIICGIYNDTYTYINIYDKPFVHYYFQAKQFKIQAFLNDCAIKLTIVFSLMNKKQIL